MERGPLVTQLDLDLLLEPETSKAGPMIITAGFIQRLHSMTDLIYLIRTRSTVVLLWYYFCNKRDEWAVMFYRRNSGTEIRQLHTVPDLVRTAGVRARSISVIGSHDLIIQSTISRPDPPPKRIQHQTHSVWDQVTILATH